MLYVRLGTANSLEEEERVIASYHAGQLRRERLSAYAGCLNLLDRNGFELEQAKWVTTRESKVVVYTGQGVEDGWMMSGRRIWAAIELDDERRVGCLLKIADDYRGDPRMNADYVTEALERFARGVRFR